MRKAATAAVTATCFFVVTSFAALSASAFEGVWKVKDTAGHPFEITLSSDGAAKATRGEGMTGTWKEEGNSAVITWNTGWTTKITKEGDRYIKAAYGKGQSLTATPTNTSEAEKAKRNCQRSVVQQAATRWATGTILSREARMGGSACNTSPKALARCI